MFPQCRCFCVKCNVVRGGNLDRSHEDLTINVLEPIYGMILKVSTDFFCGCFEQMTYIVYVQVKAPHVKMCGNTELTCLAYLKNLISAHKLNVKERLLW